jgi:hypothetical protein
VVIEPESGLDPEATAFRDTFLAEYGEAMKKLAER